MFKFMKSKKGFSLVELMIVVVIMAILVAVAVPIYNSVTGKSRAKTCIDNQRQIISVLSNDIMLTGKTELSGEIKVTYDGKNASYTITGSKPVYTVDALKGLFQTAPYCPVDGAYITVTLNGTKVSTECSEGNKDTNNPHILTSGGSASSGKGN